MNYRKIVPRFLIKNINHLRQFFHWYKQGFLRNAPQLIKQNLFLKYGISNAQWIETGTFFGDTTDFLIKNFPKVYSIEPSEYLFNYALKRFRSKKNVILFNNVSEKILPELLPSLSGDINFWLDGHYSSGITFKEGDILKSAGWKTPALNAPRGNILEGYEIPPNSMRIYGPDYLR